MTLAGVAALALVAFVAGLSAGRVEFPEETRLAGERARCAEIQNEIYMAVDDEDDSVTALTPLDELCEISRHLRSSNAWISCVQFSLQCRGK